MKFKEGDVVRVKSREWYEKNKDSSGIVREVGNNYYFPESKADFCGKHFHIEKVFDYCYGLEECFGFWEDWMLEDPDEVLTPEEAIKAMLEGEVLTDGVYSFKFDGTCFKGTEGNGFCRSFSGLRRLPSAPPEKKKRPMTRDEALCWACSAEALGWVMSYCDSDWYPSQYLDFSADIAGYKRAKMTPQGVDESTICGFEVEE